MNDFLGPLHHRRKPGRRVRRGAEARSSTATGRSPSFERLEDRCVLSAMESLPIGAVALPVDPTVQVSGTIARAGGEQLYLVTLDAQGLLVASVHSPGINPLLSLKDDRGNILIQSESGSPTNPDGRLAQHLPAGTYYLSVSDMSGVGSFALSTAFTQALPPGQAISESQGAYEVTTADLNGDGNTDLIVPDYYYDQILINYGLGDGTFQPPVAIPVGSGPTDVLAARLGDNGQVDLVVVDQLSNDLMILMGDGQGNFQVSQVLPTLPGPVRVVSGDFSGDGHLDLAVAETGADGVQTFQNQGDGTFVPASFIGSIGDPTALAVAHLNSDSKPDLAVASGSSGNLVLLGGEGNAQFAPLPYQLPVGPGCSDVISANLSGSGSTALVAVSPVTGLISIFDFDGFAFRLRGTLKAGVEPEAVVAADFNGDGHLDLAAVNYGSNNVSVFLGQGNDQFGAAVDDSTGAGPIDLAAGDFNGDGRPDLVTSDFIGLTFSVLLNHGDATFQSPPRKPPSAGPEDVINADVNGDGIPDLIVPEFGLNEVAVFLGRGDGTFRDPIEVPAGSGPEDVAVGDFSGDGTEDMAVVDYDTNTLLILKGNGDGTFEPIQTFATGDGPEFLKSADLDGDGHPDLVVANFLDNTIGVYYGQGNGTFLDAVTYSVGLGPSGIAIADLNGDGRPDIAVSDSGSDDVEVMTATGPRSFSPPVSYAAGAQPWFVTAGDFNKDGHPDLIVADGLSSPSVVSLLVNAGDGTFLPPSTFGVGGSPYPMAVGDFNGDGNLDVVTGNDVTNDLSVLLGTGNGTFQPEMRLPAGTDPYGVAVADLNGDGHLDIVSVNFQSGDLTVYNSQGDGTLQLLTTIDVGGSPSGMAVGDFNGDGRPDLVVTDASSGEVLVLLGLGDGTFQSPIRYQVGKSPRSPVVGDFRNDGILDIAVVDTDSNEVSVLLGRGDGTFEHQQVYPTGVEPVSLVAGDGTGNGFLDLGVVNRGSDNITELFGEPGGFFQPTPVNLSGIAPSTLVTGDFNGNGVPDLIISDQLAGRIDVALDLATTAPPIVSIDVGVGRVYLASADLYHDGESDLIVANADTGLITILRGWANNGFEDRYTIQANVAIAGLSMVDLNRDGLPDILITEAGTGKIETYLSGGNGVFSTPESIVALPHTAPIVFPSPRPGVSTIVDLANNGDVLTRIGIDGAVAEFGAPIDETTGTNTTFRDFAILQTGGAPDVASLDTQRPLIYVQSQDANGPSGVMVLQLPGEGNYTRLISGDLFGTGLDDLVVIDRTSDEIIIFQQTSSGVFRQYGNPIPAGFGPTDVTLAYLNPGALPDLVVADGSSGEVTVIGRDSQGGFFDEAMLPAGLATAGTVLLPDGLKRTSPDEPVGVTSGVFGPSGLADVVVVDHGTDRISILQGLPGGGLAAPSLAMTYSTGLDPIQVVAAPLGRNGLLDLVVLNEGSDDVSIFLNNGHGGFIVMPRVDAGQDPTALAVRDVTGDGLPDLVVSDANGDILILAGNGDGTFQPYERGDGTVNLAVGDLTGDGKNDFVLTNTSQDLLSVQTSTSSAGFVQGRGDGLLAPGPVSIADMNGDGIPDLIVVNTGGNDVFVYLGLGAGQFAAPLRFFTGTAPVGLTVANLTGNGLPDLVVANSGSNDVTILLGEDSPDGTWTMVPGPRLKAGNRPVSTTVADVYGNGTLDLLVVNHDSNTVTVLEGLGGGFFDDTDPLTLPTGQAPVQAFVGHFSSSILPGLVILDSQSNGMTYYSSIDATAVTIPTGGDDPIAGVAGDFNNDGFTDLTVANNGDSRITVFYGGASGLTLVQTIYLDASAHPTDLVLSATKGGGVQLFVGAEGQDRAISVYFSSVSTIVFTEPGSTDGFVMTSGLDHSSTEDLVSSVGLNPVLLQETGNIASTAVQESAQSGAQSGAYAGALGQAAAVVATLAQSAQPLFSPASRSLGWLIDNLAHLAQGETAEILPLGQSQLAEVAVLLSSPNAAARLELIETPPSTVPTEDDAPLVATYLTHDDRRPRPSRLDQFVANLGGSSVDLSGESVVRSARGTKFGAEWVWRRRPTDPSETTASFEDETARRLASRPVEPAPEIAIAAPPRPLVVSMNGRAESVGRPGPSSLPKVVAALAAVVIPTIGIIAYKAFPRTILRNLLRRVRKAIHAKSKGREPGTDFSGMPGFRGPSPIRRPLGRRARGQRANQGYLAAPHRGKSRKNRLD